ncbi:MAG: hypothetical protein ACYDHH_24690 [Solirubrobacteraceae bacterium]
MLVFTNPVEGKESEFHDWYDQVHIPDILRIKGVSAVTRYEISPLQASLSRVGVDEKKSGITQRYLAVWEVEGDLEEVFSGTRDEFAAGQVTMADVFRDAEMYVFTEIRAPARAEHQPAGEVVAAD